MNSHKQNLRDNEYILGHQAAAWAKEASEKATPHGIPMAEWSHRRWHCKELRHSLKTSLSPTGLHVTF